LRREDRAIEPRDSSDNERKHRNVGSRLLLAGLLSLIAASLAKGHDKPTDSGNRASNDKPSAPPSGADAAKKHPLEWAIAFLLFGTLVATAFAAFYTKKQWETATDTEQRSLRAYVMPTQATITIDDSNNVSVHIVTKNFGQTPASQVHFWTCLSVRDFTIKDHAMVDPILPDWGGDQSKLPKFVLPPNDVEHIIQVYFCDDGKLENRPLNGAEKQAIVARSKAIYLYGEIFYIDAFGAERWTKYRKFINGDVGVSGAAPSNAEGGNEAK
jgi:hypothetical protein